MTTRMTVALTLFTVGCAPAIARPSAATHVEVREVRRAPEPIDVPTAERNTTPAPATVDKHVEAIELEEIDASAIVTADYPPALMAGNAPSTLPPSVGPGLRHTPGKLMKSGGLGFGRLEVPDEKLVRMQIGTVRMHGFVSTRGFLYCEDDIARWRARGGKPAPPKPKTRRPSVPSLPTPPLGTPFSPKMRHPGITPARWEVLTRDPNGEAVLTISDAWFDHRSCRASVQRVTHIHPQPVLDGLAYLFKGSCADCRERDVLTLMVPTFVGANRGGRQISSGAFVMARFPLKRHRNSRLSGLVDRAPMRNWQRSLHGARAPVDAFPKTVLSAEFLWSSQIGGHRLRIFGARTLR